MFRHSLLYHIQLLLISQSHLSMCHAKPKTELNVVSVLLSTTIHVIIVVKICCGLTRLRLVSLQHFDYCDDANIDSRIYCLEYSSQDKRGDVKIQMYNPAHWLIIYIFFARVTGANQPPKTKTTGDASCENWEKKLLCIVSLPCAARKSVHLNSKRCN